MYFFFVTADLPVMLYFLCLNPQKGWFGFFRSVKLCLFVISLNILITKEIACCVVDSPPPPTWVLSSFEAKLKITSFVFKSSYFLIHRIKRNCICHPESKQFFSFQESRRSKKRYFKTGCRSWKGMFR